MLEPNRISIAPLALLGEAWARVKDHYLLFVGITVVGVLLGGMAPLGLLLGPMMCGIFLCYRQQAQGKEVTFDLLFKGFDHFMESFIGALLLIAASLVVIFPLVLVLVFGGIFAGVLVGSNHATEQATPFLVFGMMALFVLVVMVASMLIGVFFLFTFPLIMDRGLSGMDAVKLSFRAARTNFAGLAFLTLVNALLTFAGMLCCYVGVFLVLPLTLGTHWLCYERVFGIKEVEPVP